MEQHCPTCKCYKGEREISLYKGMVISLWQVFKWCQEKEVHEFMMKDIRHLLGQVNYTRFGDWVLFAGLVYKHGKANYGLNMERCDAFFRGRLSIPASIFKNPVTRMNTPGEQITISEIPSVMQFLDEDGLYIARYREPQKSLF